MSEAGTEATEQESTPAFAKRNEWGWCGEWGQITTVKPFGGEGSKTPQSQVSVPSSDMGVNGIALKWRHEQNLERVWLLTYSAVLLQRFMRRRWARREVPKPSISNATPVAVNFKVETMLKNRRDSAKKSTFQFTPRNTSNYN